MSPSPKSHWCRFCIRGSWRVAKKLFCWGLWALLGLQLFLLIGLLRNDAFTIPEFAVNLLKKNLEKEGLYFSAQAFEFTTSGWIVVKKPRLYASPARSERIFEADQAAVRFSIAALLFGHIEPLRFSVDEAVVRAPAYLSKTGVDEPLIDHLNVQVVRLDRDRWYIRQASAALFNLTIEAAGDFFLPALSPKKSATPAKKPMVQFGEATTALQQIRPWLLQLKNPRVFLRLIAQKEKRSTQLGLRIECDQYSDGHRLQSGPAALSGRFVFAHDTLTPETPLLATIENLTYHTDDDPKTAPASARILWIQLQPPQETSQWPWGVIGPVQLRASDIAAYDIALGTLNADIWPQKFPNLSLSARLIKENVAVDLNAEADVKTGTATVDAATRADPRLFLPESLLEDPGVRAVSFGQPPYLRVSAKAGPQWAFQEGTFLLELYETIYKSVHLKSAIAQGSVTETTLQTSRLELSGDGFVIAGEYRQFFKESAYRFLLKGDIPPHQLDDLMESWWLDIWNEFKLGDRYPYADIDFGGKWGTDIDSKLVGEIRLSDFDFRGVDWQTGHVGLRLAPEYTAIENILLENDEGSLTGDFVWFYKNDMRPRLMFLQHLSIQSTLPLPVLGKVGGEDVEAITQEFTSAVPPKLKGEFYMWGVGSATAGENRIDLSATFAGEASIFQVPVRDLSLEVTLDDRRVKITPIRSGFAGGILSGTLVLSSDPLGTRADFDFDIEGADHARFLEEVAKMRPVRDIPKDSPTPLLADKPKEPGDMHLQMIGTGVFGHADTFDGRGSVAIKDAEIGRFNVLGSLSTFLEKTVFPSAQLHFTGAQSEIFLKSGILTFPNLTITGPICKIEAAGRYSMVNQAIDFRVRFYPFGNLRSNMIQTIVSAIHPISNTFAIQLTGTSKDPSWQLDFSPTQLFRFGSATPEMPAQSSAFDVQKPPAEPKTLEKPAE